MDSNDNGTVEASEKIPISFLNGIHIGSIQLAGGSSLYIAGAEFIPRTLRALISASTTIDTPVGADRFRDC